MKTRFARHFSLLLLVLFMSLSTAYAAEKGAGGAATVARKGELALGFDFGIGGGFSNGACEQVGVGAVSSLSYQVIDHLGLTFRFGYAGAISPDSASVGTHLIPFLFGIRYSLPIVKKLSLVNAFGIGPAVGVASAKNVKTDAFAFVGINFFTGFEYEVANFLGLNFGVDTIIGARKNAAGAVLTTMVGLRYYLPL